MGTADNRNFRASHLRCTSLWDGCTASLDALTRAVLPSRRRHYARLRSCNETMLSCVGPAAAPYHAKLATLGSAGTTAKEFFARVSHLFTLLCVGGILIFRYVCRLEIAELGCWAAMLVVEVGPKLHQPHPPPPHPLPAPIPPYPPLPPPTTHSSTPSYLSLSPPSPPPSPLPTPLPPSYPLPTPFSPPPLTPLTPPQR